MLTRTQIQRLERESNDYPRQINECFQHRDKSKVGFRAWEKACKAWHEWENPCFYLWYLKARDRMRRGEREVIEDALLFLEVDPWFFRSGYLTSGAGWVGNGFQHRDHEEKQSLGERNRAFQAQKPRKNPL